MASQPPIREIDWKKAAQAVQDVATAQNVPTSVFPKPTEAPTVPHSETSPEGQGGATRLPKTARPAKQSVPAPSPTKTFSCVLPVYLIEEIQSRTFHARPHQTTNYTTLMAFKEAGFHVKAEDLVPDRRRSRPKA